MSGIIEWVAGLSKLGCNKDFAVCLVLLFEEASVC